MASHLRTLLALLVALVCVTSLAKAAGAQGRAEQCHRCPVCDFSKGVLPPLACVWPRLPWGPHAVPDTATVVQCLDYHLAAVVGQDHVTTQVREDILHKLRNPNEPLRLHFGGDNGVGKSLLARQLSLATSLRLHRECREHKTKCLKGENLLEIQAGGFLGLKASDARAIIVKEIGEHLEKFPHGIVLLDDLTLMDGDLVEFLAPLFGRGDHFAETPHVDLNKAIIIITSDFRGANHSRGLFSLQQLEQEIKAQAKAAYQIAPLGAMKTIAFWALDSPMVAQLVSRLVAQLPCREPSVTRASIEPLALQWILEDGLFEKDRLAKDSGRYVEQRVLALLDTPVSGHIMKEGHDIQFSVHCRLNERGDFSLDLRRAGGATTSTDDPPSDM